MSSVGKNGRNIAVNEWYTPFLKKEFPCSDCPFRVNPFYNSVLKEFEEK